MKRTSAKPKPEETGQKKSDYGSKVSERDVRLVRARRVRLG